MKEVYRVKNIYGVKGGSRHFKVSEALKARDAREGVGWVVTDSMGNRWDWDFAGTPRISEPTEEEVLREFVALSKVNDEGGLQ